MIWSEDCICCTPPDEEKCAAQAQVQDLTTLSFLRSQMCYPTYTQKVMASAVDDDLEAAIRKQVGAPGSRQGLPSATQGERLWVMYGWRGIMVARGCVISVRGGVATSCSEEYACEGFDCSYLGAFLLIMEVISALNPLPDMDFVLCAMDFVVDDNTTEVQSLPVFT